ncbi:MAG: DNA cytosine methyltransferase [Nanoarchaeota archaeon]
MEKENSLTVLDLFCGIGGFSKGFEKAGFNIVAGIDNWGVALKTFKMNHKNTITINADLREIGNETLKKYSGKIDIIIAGPPCQGFSMSGKRYIDDKRNTLFEEVIRAVNLIYPKVVIIENVVGLLSMKNSDGEFIKDLIKRKLEKEGYEIEYKILNASDYGVPQARKRVIFIGSKIGKIDFPKIKDYKVTVGDALGNLLDVEEQFYLEPKTNFQKLMADGERKIYNHEKMNHNKEVLNRIKYVPQGGNWQDIPKEFYNVCGEHSNNYRRLDSKQPSITLKHATKSMIIHPKFDRVITAREVARLQSFSDSFILSGTRFEQHQQLANAVPPLLAFEVAKTIKYKLEKNEI